MKVILLAKDSWRLSPIVIVRTETGRRYVLTQNDATWGTPLFEQLWRKQ